MILLLFLLLLQVAQVAVGKPALARVLQVVENVVLGRALEDRLDRRRVVRAAGQRASESTRQGRLSFCLFKRMFSARFSSFINHQKDRKVISCSQRYRSIAGTSNKIKIKIFVHVSEGMSPILMPNFFKHYMKK